MIHYQKKNSLRSFRCCQIILSSSKQPSGDTYHMLGNAANYLSSLGAMPEVCITRQGFELKHRLSTAKHWGIYLSELMNLSQRNMPLMQENDISHKIIFQNQTLLCNIKMLSRHLMRNENKQ